MTLLLLLLLMMMSHLEAEAGLLVVAHAEA
jgi:hypothetical protein